MAIRSISHLTPIIPNLVRDVSIIVYNNMCGATRYKMSMVSQEWYKFCVSEIPQKTYNSNTSYTDLKLLIQSDNILYVIRSVGIKDIYQPIVFSCMYNNIELLTILFRKIKRYYVSNTDVPSGLFYLEQGMLYACRHASNDAIRFLLDNGATDWHSGLKGACQGGHLDIAKTMIDKFVTSIPWNDVLSHACIVGNIDIVKLAIDNGACEWDQPFKNACGNGHINVIQSIIDNYRTNVCLTFGLLEACMCGEYDVVTLLIDKAVYNYDVAFEHLCIGYHHNQDVNKDITFIKIMNLLIGKGVTYCEECGRSTQDHLP